MTRVTPGRTLAVIPARGGSKGIPNKNLIDLCGKPLIAWTVMQAAAARGVDVVEVTSDSDQILAAAEAAGAVGVRRPEESPAIWRSSESAWLHALEQLEGKLGPFGRVVALQATSPIRESSDIEQALAKYEREELDRLFSVAEVEDYFNWRSATTGPNRSTTISAIAACASRSKSAIWRTARSTSNSRAAARAE